MAAYNRSQIAVFVVFIGLLQIDLAQGQTPRVIAKSGDDAPGLPGVTYFTGSGSFAAPFMSSTGNVVYFSGLSGSGITTNINDSAIWTYSAGSSSLVAQRGQAAPTLSGVTFGTISSVGSVSANNPVVFTTTLTGSGITTGSNDSAIWQGTSPNNLQLILRNGSATPGLASTTVATISAGPYLLPDNRHVIPITVSGSGVTTANDNAILIGSPGNLSVFYREGTVVPGTSGATTTSLNLSGVGPSGVLAIRSTITGGDATGTTNNIIHAGTAGNLQLLMRSGSTPTGIPAGQTVNSFGSLAPVLQNGTVYFAASLTGTGVTTANSTTVWVGTSTTDLQMVFRGGQQVPGLPNGVQFSTFGTPRAAGNRVVFTAQLQGTGVTTANDNYVGSWSASSGVQVIAREGDVAPNTNGALFGTFLNSPLVGSQGPPILGSDDVLAFRTSLTGSGVDATNNLAIYIRDVNGLRLVARKGDLIDLGSGVTGTIADLTFGDSLIGNPVGNTSLSANGDFAFLATLTDGRSLVIYVPVPEPATALTVGTIASLLVIFRKKLV